MNFARIREQTLNVLIDAVGYHDALWLQAAGRHAALSLFNGLDLQTVRDGIATAAPDGVDPLIYAWGVRLVMRITLDQLRPFRGRGRVAAVGYDGDPCMVKETDLQRCTLVNFAWVKALRPDLVRTPDKV
jgi:hypothetical protein